MRVLLIGLRYALCFFPTTLTVPTDENLFGASFPLDHSPYATPPKWIWSIAPTHLKMLVSA
jgi:hypothetical protein